MAITLTVNGIPFEYPETGEIGAWGEPATEWAQAITNAINSVVTSGDIPLSSVTIANNQTSAALVTGLNFEIATVKGAFVEYNIQRSVTGTRYSETGMLIITYNELSTSWEIARYKAGQSGPEDAASAIKGVEFSMVNEGSVGQVRYVSENMAGSSYAGTMRFRARVIK